MGQFNSDHRRVSMSRLLKTSMVSMLSASLMGAASVMAQTPLPPSPALPSAQDVPYPGTMELKLDVTDLDHRVFRVHQDVPVPQGAARAGDFVLVLPKWLPGHHAPGTELTKIAGLVVTSGDKVLAWRRDDTAVNAFHIPVDAKVKTISVDFEYLSATEQRLGHVFQTQDMLNIQWNTVSLYPAGYYVSRIPVHVSIKYPQGFKAATALEPQSVSAENIVDYAVTDYETVMDSPVYAGRYFTTVELDPGGPAPVRLNVVADNPELLKITDEQIGIHRALVREAYATFGAHHYNHYDFLVSASEFLGGNGLEHHRSSEDGVDPKYFTDWKTKYIGRDLLAHEFTHSWDGKFRRGADLWTPDYQTPMRDSLLWVYEGQTQFWGYVLSARSGLYSKQQALDGLALIAANLDNLPARAWRDLADTTNDPIISSRTPQGWRSYQRSEDYYNEGLLIWFDADTLIREKTGGQKSLDDFAHAFFGIRNGDWDTATYEFKDVVANLNSVYPYDWANFLNSRLHGHGPGAPLDGFVRGGYRLIYTATPSDYFRAYEGERKTTNLMYSLGVSVNAIGTLTDVLWDGPAFKSGLSTGTQIVAVNGKIYTSEILKDAITAAKDADKTLTLIVRTDDNFRTVSINYHGGLRYPRFERIDASKPALIDDILTPRTGTVAMPIATETAKPKS